MRNEEAEYWEIQAEKRSEIIMDLIKKQSAVKKQGEQIIKETRGLIDYYKKEIANIRVELLEKEQDIYDLLLENEFLRHEQSKNKGDVTVC